MKTNGRWLNSYEARTSMKGTFKSGSFVKSTVLGLLAASVFTLAGCSDSEVGDVSLGLFTTKDIKIDAVNIFAKLSIVKFSNCRKFLIFNK